MERRTFKKDSIIRGLVLSLSGIAKVVSFDKSNSAFLKIVPESLISTV